MHPVDHIKNRQKSKKFQPAAAAMPTAPNYSALPGGASPAAPPAPPKRQSLFTGGHAMMEHGK